MAKGFFRVLSIFLCISVFDVKAPTDVREAEENLIDRNMDWFEEQYGSLSKPEQVDKIEEYFSQNPSTLLVFAKEIGNPVNWFGVGRAMNLEGTVMRAVMLAYGLPLPVDFEESLWGKKEHMRDVSLFAVSKHLQLKAAADKSDDPEAYMKDIFSEIRKYSLTIPQVLYAKKCVEELGDFPYFHNVSNIGDLPVRPSGTPLGLLQKTQKFKAYFSSEVEEVKKDREEADITISGRIGRFFTHTIKSILFPPYVPLRLWFIYESNKSFRLLQLMCERIIANAEMVKAGLSKTASLEDLKNNSNTTPFEALLNDSGMSRTRLKEIAACKRVATRAVKNFFEYRSIKTDGDLSNDSVKKQAKDRALKEIEDALTESAKSSNPNAKKQFVAISYSCADPDNGDALSDDELRKTVLSTIAREIAIPDYQTLIDNEEFKKLKKQIIQTLSTSEAWSAYPQDFGYAPDYVEDPYAALGEMGDKIAPFFVNLKELQEQRANFQPVTEGAKSGVAVTVPTQ